MALKKTTVHRRRGTTNARKGIDTAKKHGIIAGGKNNPIQSVRTLQAIKNTQALRRYENNDKVIDKVKRFKNPANK